MNTLGLEIEARKLNQCLIEISQAHCNRISQRSLRFWNEAVTGETC
jgi:hypothetical protein